MRLQNAQFTCNLMKKGVLLVNLGTPDSPSVKDVRKYLTQFLNDPRVIDIPAIARFFLVNFIIVPFRAPKSAALYKKIWTPEGSPLLTHGKKIKNLLRQSLGGKYSVELGMRYGNPSIEDALDILKNKKVEHIIIIPLYPQYASSSTGSTMEEIFRIMKTWEVVPSFTVSGPFYNNPLFIEAFARRAEQCIPASYDHILFSYHGLPERHIIKASAEMGSSCTLSQACCSSINENNHSCYRAACYETTRLIAERLKLTSGSYSVSFQSRLGKEPWIKPYTEEIVKEKARQGIKRMLVIAPAFVADCLETLYEIGVEYDVLFREHGGEKLQMAESLNDHPAWVEALKSMVLKSS